MTKAKLYQTISRPQAIVLWFVLLVSPTVLDAAAEVRRAASVEDKVEQLEKQLQTANRMRAEFQFQITNLQKEVRDLRGLVEEQAYLIEQLTGRQRDIFRDLDDLRTQTPSTSGGSTTVTPTPPVDNSGPSTIQNNATSGSMPSVSDADIRKQYDDIFPMVRAKRFDEAIVEYQKFIAAYPDSSFVSSARYWLGQIYNVQGRTDEAQGEYLLVIQDIDAPKAPDALLKLGELLEKRGQTDQATQYYQQLLQQYPDSNPARFAQARLDGLSN